MSDARLSDKLEAALAKAAQNAARIGGEVRLHASDWMAIQDALNAASVAETEWTEDEVRQSVLASIAALGCSQNVFARSHGISHAKLSEFLSGRRGAEPGIIEPMGFRWALLNASDHPRPVSDREKMRADIINAPETVDFMAAVPIEAVHQRERWGADHDGGKTPFDWFWLIGYLAQKAASSHLAGDVEKAKHHTISTAAALANWHAHISGKTAMRPGIGPSDGVVDPATAIGMATALSADDGTVPA